MKNQSRRLGLVAICFCLLALPFITAYGADGRLEGKVTDPKGAVVVGAKIVATDPATGQTFNGTTDNQGHYSVNVPPGTYTVVVSAMGFGESRRDGVKVGDGAVATLDVKMDVASVEA